MQQEKYSFWNYLDPFERSGTHFPHACTGLKPSCQLCPSFMPASRLDNPSSGIGKLEFNPAAFEKVNKKKTPCQWLVPANTDAFAGQDISDDDIFNLIKLFEATPNHTFFFCTKNLCRMAEYWRPIDNVFWGVSASTQEEVNFQSHIRDLYQPYTSPAMREFLLLAPLTEEIILPESSLYQFDYIIVDGFHAEANMPEPEMDIPFYLEWIEAIANQLQAAESTTELIINGLGDQPYYHSVSFSTKKKKFCSTTVEELIREAMGDEIK